MYVMLLFLLLLTGCRSVEYVPMETVRTDTVYRNKVERDRVYVRDSVYVFAKGDTVFMTKWAYRWRDRVRTDTVYVSRRDTVRVPYPVEKRLNRWERVKMQAGEAVVSGVCVLMGLLIVWYVIRRFRR